MKRRSTLKLLVYSASLLASGVIPIGISRLMTPETPINPKRHLRPPGALNDEQAFNAACIGCGLCGEVCPPRCIQFHQRDGGAKANTPYINPEEKACTLCAKCMEVCPTNALTVVARDQITMGISQIDRSACYPWVDRGICGACVAICPLGEKGIKFKRWNQYQPIVQNACVGCGLCVEVCPHPSLPIRIVERTKGTITEHVIAS